MLSIHAVPVISPPATLIQLKRVQSLAGKLNTVSKKCAGIAGTGSGRIRMGIDRHSVFIIAEFHGVRRQGWILCPAIINSRKIPISL